jgi:polycystin 1L2
MYTIQRRVLRRRFFFVCSRWMAVEEDDGQIERIIPVAGANDLTQFNQMFAQSVRKKFSNDHMWASIFSRPTRSTFTRVQRVSSCVALLFLTMITNCMFFKSADPDHATEVHIGPITLTIQQIYISVVSTCIVFPPSVLIVTIFRKVSRRWRLLARRR